MKKHGDDPDRMREDIRLTAETPLASEIVEAPHHRQGDGERHLTRTLTALGSLVILGMMLYIVANALGRTFFNSPLPAAIELTEYWFMPLLVALGLVGAQLDKAHVEADLFFESFSSSIKRHLTLAILVFTIVFLMAATYFTLNEALYAMSHEVKAGLTQVPAWPAYFGTPLAFALMAVISFVHLLRAFPKQILLPSYLSALEDNSNQNRDNS